MKVQRYQDKKGHWRWRFIAANGKQIARSSEGYINQSDCDDSISLTFKRKITIEDGSK